MSESLDDWGLDRVDDGAWLDGTRRARVVRVDRGECDVMTTDGRVRVLSDSQRAQGEIAPVTGDWVEIEETDGLGTVIGRVLPRRTAVSRRDPAEKDLEQVLASNVDVVAAVLGLDRPVQAGWLERLLVMAIDSGAEPLVVLTKADEAESDAPAFAIVDAVANDVPVIVTSVVDGTGLDEVLARIGATRTLALVGESGAGKSSLVNALVGEELLEVGEVRASDAEGRHTTTARELILLPDDAGMILETPGIRTLGLWEAEHAVDLVFGDLVALAEHCRFRDCAHRGEPGCAVQAAVDAGEVPKMRMLLLLELVDELDNLRKREEQRARRQKGGGRRRQYR
ncbi:MAG: ribosome small subunit-dependent GTPase A [Actinomycetota bacterium]